MLSFPFHFRGKKITIRLRDKVCQNSDELISSDLFHEVVRRCVQDLAASGSQLIRVFGFEEVSDADLKTLIQTLLYLAKMPADLVPNVVPGAAVLLRDRDLFSNFVEFLYNYWRRFDRFIICDSEGDVFDKYPYRTFNATVESLMHLIRGVYRDVAENLTGSHPRIYRQVRAGAGFATIALPKAIPLPEGPLYAGLARVPVARQVLLYPPLVLTPPMNKRTGKFERLESNPIASLEVNPREWLCYPARVGDLLILIYYHETFYELGFSLSNLFELAGNEALDRRPDAVYLFGVPEEQLPAASREQTGFYDDGTPGGMLTAFVSNNDRFGYFGYLKKMVLTLHNICMMNRGRLPFHGALVKVLLRGGREAAVLILGDTGAGKSETLEALRTLGSGQIRDIIVVADDMGSLEIGPNGRAVGYGTEIGAFLRLDDLQPGYALGQMDRAIIMSPGEVNARIVLPVTPYSEVIRGHAVDYVLYANNYEEIDEDHPVLERFAGPDDALKVFREGTVMSKGTTTTTGLVHSYFANIFGPPQYRAQHEELAVRYFKAFFGAGLFVGQLRTRLGVAGQERRGPEEAARVLLDTLTKA